MFWIILIVAVGVDQLTKYLIVNSLALGESIPVINNFLDFTYTLNEGCEFFHFAGPADYFYYRDTGSFGYYLFSPAQDS